MKGVMTTWLVLKQFVPCRFRFLFRVESMQDKKGRLEAVQPNKTSGKSRLRLSKTEPRPAN